MDKNILKKEIDNEIIKKVSLYLLSFFIPTIIMIAIFAYVKVYPFGNDIYLPVDAYGQYSSFLIYFRGIFFNGNSIFYSLGKSLGGEVYGLIAYYLLSPYNLITLFFNSGNITLAYNIILILKTASTGVAFTYYLNRRKKADFRNLIFSMMYAFSAYVITYGFNIMWLDSVILLPLVIAGLDDLIKYKKFALYTISLSLTLITNYYMGFMVCIFCVIYFVYKMLVKKHKSKKEFFRRVGLFIIYSLIAGLISAVVLLPVFTGLRERTSGLFI